MSMARQALLQRAAQMSEADALGADGFSQAAQGIVSAQASIVDEMAGVLPRELQIIGFGDRSAALVAAIVRDERTLAQEFESFGSWSWACGIESGTLLELLTSLRMAASRVLIAAGAPPATVGVLERRCAYAMQAARDGHEAAITGAAEEAHQLLARASRQLDDVEKVALEALSILRLLHGDDETPLGTDEGTKALARQAESLLEDLTRVLA